MAAQKLGLEVYKLGRLTGFRGVDLLCIGTDRATGDSLGPLVGERLRRKLDSASGLVRLFGTLEKPVHATNLTETILHISKKAGRLLIAVDASLGKAGHVGTITVGRGSILPGACLSKDLPAVGDIFITGVVNTHSSHAGATLQSTRLAVVMRMARAIARGLLFGVGMLCYEGEITACHTSPDYYSRNDGRP